MDTLPVTLIVKAPNQQFEDQTIKCELSWSIRRLKGYLSEVYPCNPSLDEQKLIYSGQLLNDAHILKDILRQYEGQETHTVHLVFTPKNKNYQNMVSNTVQKRQITTTPVRPSANVSARTDTTDGLRQRNLPQNSPQGVLNVNTTHMPGMHFNANGSNPPQTLEQQAIAQQMMMHNMMHQMYLQYLNHYAMATQTNQQAIRYPYGTPYFPQNSEDHSSQVPNGQGPNRNNEPVRQPDAQAQRLQNDNDVENRDWLDILYTFSRLIVLLSLVYFYSSPGRCSIVILVMVLYYFYQNHQRNLREQQAVENQQVAPENEAANDPQEGDVPENNTDNEQSSDSSANLIDAAAESESTSSLELEDNNRLPTIALVRTFVLSFFASLIPETPAV